jgi:AcrR family transcriptional regulator
LTNYLTFVRIFIEYGDEQMKIPNQTKDKILETAIDLFSRSGFSAVSIRDITREVGIKESSLYYHFKNKDELLASIFSLFQEEVQKVCPPINKLDEMLSLTEPELFLKQGFRNFKAYICDNPTMSKISRILSSEQFSHPKARSIILHDLYEQNINFLEIVFAKLIDLRLVQPHPARLLAVEYQYPIFSMITEYQILKFDHQDTTVLEKQMEEHVEFFFHKVKI